MATFTVRQVLPQSVDDAGISTVTATLDTTNPRTGQVYNPTTLAAAAPVWFHRLPDGRCVGLFARRLTQAVPADPQPGGPLVYSAATTSTVPSWAIFDPTSGAVRAVETIPTDTEGDRVLRAAASRGDYLFVLSTIGDDALLQHFRVDRMSALLLQAEEIVPAGLGLGLHVERNDLWVFGSVDGKLTLARKNWGRIGENNSRNPFLRWRYRTDKGWSFDVGDLEPLPGDIPTTGPVSIARLRDRYYLTMPVYTPLQPAVAATSTRPATPEVPGRWDAKTWTARSVDRTWTRHPFTVPLGGDQSYIGGTAYLQPGLSLTPGFTRTATSNGQTVLDGGSDPVQVFTGVAHQIVVLPDSPVQLTPAAPGVPATYRPYTLYNQTLLAELRVVTATGAAVAVVGHGRALTLTPTAAAPTAADQWTTAVPTGRVPDHRVGYPYVATTRLSAGGNTTLVTSWGAFEV